MKSTWHEFFLDNLTLPNLLSAFRLLLTPVFILLFLRVQTPAQYYYTVTLAAILALSDLADGWIARRYHQVTDLGKFSTPCPISSCRPRCSSASAPATHSSGYSAACSWSRKARSRSPHCCSSVRPAASWTARNGGASARLRFCTPSFSCCSPSRACRPPSCRRCYTCAWPRSSPPACYTHCCIAASGAADFPVKKRRVSAPCVFYMPYNSPYTLYTRKSLRQFPRIFFTAICRKHLRRLGLRLALDRHLPFATPAALPFLFTFSCTMPLPPILTPSLYLLSKDTVHPGIFPCRCHTLQTLALSCPPPLTSAAAPARRSSSQACAATANT